jgi:hypothetical protein
MTAARITVIATIRITPITGETALSSVKRFRSFIVCATQVRGYSPATHPVSGSRYTLLPYKSPLQIILNDIQRTTARVSEWDRSGESLRDTTPYCVAREPHARLRLISQSKNIEVGIFASLSESGYFGTPQDRTVGRIAGTPVSEASGKSARKKSKI